jgi:hypothetical protein
MFVSADDFKGINVNHPAAASADIPIGLPVRVRWLYLIPIFITGVETIAGRTIPQIQIHASSFPASWVMYSFVVIGEIITQGIYCS